MNSENRKLWRRVRDARQTLDLIEALAKHDLDRADNALRDGNISTGIVAIETCLRECHYFAERYFTLLAAKKKAAKKARKR